MTSLPNSIGSLQDIKGRHGSPPDFSDLRMATLVTAGPLAKELRIDWGPGYRVYYAIAEKRVILLCEGGDKRTQKMDIIRAQGRWRDWKERIKHGRSSQTR